MSTEQFNISCGACQWFNKLDSHKGAAGECRADRPTVVVMPSASVDRFNRPMQAEIQVCFPTVPATLWCGRFMPRKVELPATEEPESQPSIATDLN